MATVAQNLNPTGGEIVVDVRPGLSVAVAPATFSVSDNGVLAFHSSPPNRRQLVWFNRKGERQGHAGEPRDYMQMALSPDGQHVVLTTRNRRSWLNWNLEILKLATNVLSQLSSGDGRDADPIWSPDSSRVVYGRYVAHLGEQVDLMEVKLGDSASTRLYGDGQSNKPETWSGDGRFLIVRRNEQFPFRLPLSGGGRPADLFVAPHFRSGFRFSPSGQWLAYSSYESGVAEVYVCRYPEMKPTIQVSTGGGLTPVWRGDGRELFYMTPKGVLVSLKVDGGSRLNFGPPTELFRTNARNIHMRQFGVTDDGQRFLVLEALPSEVADERLVVMTDWHQAVMP